MGTDHSEKTTVRRGKKGTFWKQPEMFILRVSRLRGGGGGLGGSHGKPRESTGKRHGARCPADEILGAFSANGH